MSPPPLFGVEQWMNKYETICEYNLAESCCASISIKELCFLSENKSTQPFDLVDASVPQTYGEVPGALALREKICALYHNNGALPLTPDNVIITPGGIAANHLVFYALLGPGDHVICQYPTYQQLYSVPESLGAEVEIWRCKPENEWIPDVDELKAMIKPTTKLIVLNTPQNPTGAALPNSLLQSIILLAAEHDIPILADEVYQPIFLSGRSGPRLSPSVISLNYPKAISTGSMSKAYSLAGLRVGWIASRDSSLVERIAATRDYTTISVSRLDQDIAAFALSSETVSGLLERNVLLARENIALLERFIADHNDYCTWVKPVAGTTAFVRFQRDGKAVDAKRFCQELIERLSILLLPGDVGFGPEFKGYVRIGYVIRREVLAEGIKKLRSFMREEFAAIPLCE